MFMTGQRNLTLRTFSKRRGHAVLFSHSLQRGRNADYPHASKINDAPAGAESPHGVPSGCEMESILAVILVDRLSFF